MSAEYVKKVNDKPLAASEAAPSSPLATTLAGKQDSLGIDPTSGAVTKFLNEKGQFVVPAQAPGSAAYEHTNEINYTNVPTTGNKDRHWFNYRNGDTDQADSNNLLTDYYFGNRNNSTNDVYLHADGFAPRIINGGNSNILPFAKFNMTNTGTAKGFVHFKCVFIGTNNDDAMGQVDITLKIRQNNWHALASKCVRSGGEGSLDYGEVGNFIYWSTGTTVYIGVRPGSYNAKLCVFVQYCELNGTATYTLGNYLSDVSALAIHDGDNRDVTLARALYGTSGERMAFAYNPSALGSGSPVADAEAYWASLAQRTEQVVYNNRGNEYTLFFSKSELFNNHCYGSILRWGYNAPYLEMLRVHADTWMSSDWETICPPSVLCFEYTTDTSGMKALASALTTALANRKIGSSTSYTNYKPIVFLHKSGEYYMLTYQGGGAGQGGGTHVWHFQKPPHNTQSSVTCGYIFTDSWSGDTHTYSWSNLSSVSFTADLTLKISQDTYYASSGNATIEITNNTSLYYTILMNGSAVFTLDTDSDNTIHTLLVCKRRTSDPCATVTIQWRSMTGAWQEMIVRDVYSTLAYNHEMIFDVWIRRVSTPGSSTYAIATVTPQAPRYVDMLADKTNWGQNNDDFENGVFGMSPNYFNS